MKPYVRNINKEMAIRQCLAHVYGGEWKIFFEDWIRLTLTFETVSAEKYQINGHALNENEYIC